MSAADFKPQPHDQPLMVVVTDGVPNDAEPHFSTEQVIVRTAKWLEAHRQPLNQICISFFGVGNNVQGLSNLVKLDDELRDRYGLDRDMVDCTSLKSSGSDPEKIIKILVGAIHSHVDAFGSALS